jgi:putative ABC transport system permease protein
METKEAFRIAVQSLWANKLRSVLTLLGVVIGVASVIAVVTLVNGANGYVSTKINSQGADVFTISQQPAFTTSYKDYLRYQKRKVISLEQYHAVQSECSLCLRVGALQSTTGKIVYGSQSSTDTNIRGYTALMPEMQNLNIVEGRGYTQADEDHAAHVAIIGSDIEENLLKYEDPIGKEIRVDGVPYTIIGLGEKQGKTLGQSQDNWVGVPLTAYQKTYGTAKTVTIYAKAPSGAAGMEAASDQARVIMRELRHDLPGEEDSFTLETSSALAGLLGQVTGSIGAVAIAIAAISLVVGGVVIMNIMLVSVTERTREIGVRKALGARRADVLVQFLMESSLLALVGGAFGVALGVGAALGVAALVDFPATVAVWSIFAGLLVALSVGIFFGVYPARKAADLDPIVALRSEF